MATCIPRVDGLSTDPRVWGITPVFPNCSIFVSLGLYLGILYCFLNVFGCSFILLGPHTCPMGFTSIVSFKFILCISIIISSTFTYLTHSSIIFPSIICFPSFLFLFFSNSKYCSNNFSYRLPFSISSLFIVHSGYFLNIICFTIFPVVPLTYFGYFPILIRVFCYISIFIILFYNLFIFFLRFFLIYYMFFLQPSIFLPLIFPFSRFQVI